MSDRSHLISIGKPFQYDSERDAKFEKLIKRYPTRESLILPALWLIQEQEGWICQEAVAYAADRIGAFASAVYEAATFYTMFHLRPMGRYHLCICRTLSCWLRGKQELIDFLKNDIGITPGGITADGRFSLEEVECLGHCGTAPVIQVNGDFHEDMDVDKLKALLAKLQ